MTKTISKREKGRDKMQKGHAERQKERQTEKVRQEAPKEIGRE